MTTQQSGQTTHAKTRPLSAKYIADRSIPVLAKFGALSHVGNKRKVNEDHYAIVRRTRNQEVLVSNMDTGEMQTESDHAYLLMVADGVGGAKFGDEASALVLQTISDVSERFCSWIMKLEDIDAQLPEIKERVAVVASRIQQAFQLEAIHSPKKKGMGTTLTVASLMGSDALIASIGDSRAYLFRNGKLQQITRDHTLEQAKLEAGVDPRSANRVSHVLTRCFGAKTPNATPDINYVRFHDGDFLLLCSDGLSDMVSDAAIANQLQTVLDPQLACQALVDLALQNGGKDNVTVVATRIEIPTAGDKPAPA